MTRVKILVHRAGAEAAIEWLGPTRFKRCCEDISEFPTDGERHGGSPFWHRDFEFREGSRLVNHRFWYVHSANPPRIWVMAVERVHRRTVASIAEKVLSIGADIAQWFELFK